jgi:hypothetical protein
MNLPSVSEAAHRLFSLERAELMRQLVSVPAAERAAAWTGAQLDRALDFGAQLSAEWIERALGEAEPVRVEPAGALRDPWFERELECFEW